MNILISANYQSPYGGNFLGSLLDLGQTLRARGDELFFLFPKTVSGERFWTQWIRDAGFHVFLMDLNQMEEKQLNEVLRIIFDNRIDIVHDHFGLLYSFFLHDRKKFGNVRLLVHDHMGFPSDVKKAAVCKRKNSIRALAFMNNQIGVISVLQQKDESYKLNIGRHWYIPNGISYRRCIQESLSREKRRAEMGIEGNKNLVLIFGWDFAIKGIDVAIKAIKKARRLNKSIELAIVLQKSEPTEKEIDYLRDKTSVNVKESSWIHFWPPSEDVYSYHRAADLFLSASRTEAFPYSVLEAIALDKPIVISEIEGTKWAKIYSRSISFETESAEECANAILKGLLLGSQKSNRELVLKKYSIEKWIDSIIQVYDKGK